MLTLVDMGSFSTTIREAKSVLAYIAATFFINKTWIGFIAEKLPSQYTLYWYVHQDKDKQSIAKTKDFITLLTTYICLCFGFILLKSG